MLLTEFGQAKLGTGQGRSMPGLNIGLLLVSALIAVEEATTRATMGCHLIGCNTNATYKFHLQLQLPTFNFVLLFFCSFVVFCFLFSVGKRVICGEKGIEVEQYGFWTEFPFFCWTLNSILLPTPSAKKLKFKMFKVKKCSRKTCFFHFKRTNLAIYAVYNFEIFSIHSHIS